MRQVNHIPAVVLVIAFTLTMALPRSTAYAAGSAFQVPAGQRQLFLDDVGIVKIENLTRTMHQPAKKGAVIRPDTSLGMTSLQIRSAPSWDPKKQVYRLWDTSDPEDLNRQRLYCSGYHESRDGLNWYQPVIGQVEHRGSQQNHFVRVMIDGKPARLYSFVYDPTEPDPALRFKGLAHPARMWQPVVGDGVTWQQLDVPPLSGMDELNLSFDEQTHLFIFTGKSGGPHGRSVHLETSKDFKTWTNHGLIFHADKRDQQLGRKRIAARLADPTLKPLFYNKPPSYNVDVYNMGVFRYESLYIGMPAMYHATGPLPEGNTEGFHLIELACSRDLRNWTRLGDREAFIGPSRLGSGAYDLQQIIGPSDAVRRGDELWFYYTGHKYRGKYIPGSGFKPDRDSGAICLAVLRRDGFISLDAGEQEGTVLTDPFKLSGTKLFVNVDAPKGELRAEMLDGVGKVVAQSEPLTGDLLRDPVTWAEGNIADLKGQTASLRFTLRNGQFYSYWLE